MPHIEEFLHSLADLARARWENYGQVVYRDKGGAVFDPVTALDLEIEQAVRARIREAFPDDGVWGEEEGWTNEGAPRHWSLDPVDGTRALICGLPNWAVLVALVENNQPIAGMIYNPVLEERLIATGGTTKHDRREVRTSGCAKLELARLSTTDPFLFNCVESEAFERVRRGALLTRFGLDALSYARVATGKLDLVVESSLKRHDMDATIAVVRGAGGHVGDWSGGEDWNSGRIVAASSRALYDEAVALLAV